MGILKKETIRVFWQLGSLLRYRKSLLLGKTFYPEVPLKNRTRIFIDQMHFILRYGYYEPYYFNYGFDRKSMTWKQMTDEYLVPHRKFVARKKQLNTRNPKYGDSNGLVFTDDKFYFGMMLKNCGVSTPEIFLYVKNKKILFISSQFCTSNQSSDMERLRDFLSNDMDVFAKPVGGAKGKGVFSIRITCGRYFVNGSASSLAEVVTKLMSGDYLVQQRIYQHPDLDKLCDSTVNTFRLVTVMDKDENVIPLPGLFRIGRTGKSVDNWSLGGIIVGIDMEKGRLSPTGFMDAKYGAKMLEHPDTHIKFEDVEIPFFHEAVAQAIALHRILYHCHSVGWDIAITKDGPVFIEGNSLWSAAVLQNVHGGLKKEYGKYFGF